MPAFASQYTDDQRSAMAEAYADRGIRPAQRVVDLAAAGELDYRGAQLEPFTTNANTVRDCARILKKRRAGKVRSQLAHEKPRDSVEALRKRLVAAADHALADVERRQRSRSKAKPEPSELREIARAVREIAAIPTIDEPRPVAPGQKIPGAGNVHEPGGKTTSGLAGAILADHARGSTHTYTHIGDGSRDRETSDTPVKREPAENAPDTDASTQAENATETGEPCDPARAQVEAWAQALERSSARAQGAQGAQP